MPHLFQPAGDAALGAVLRRSPLLAFDFDGTLAPIVPTPEQARISRSVSGKLRRLASRLPVAIVSGRSVADVSQRLDFEPHYVVGSHGAEMGSDAPAQHANELDDVRRLLAAQCGMLQTAGVMLEDKGLSLALHYRLSRCPDQALALIRDTLRPIEGQCRTFSGKMVENVVPAGAPDKSGAVHRLVAHCGADCAVFIGDDVNDEPVFVSAPPDWLTVRVGRNDPASRARFFVDSTAEVALVLDRMLSHVAA
jgi:trehalose 6-phosphate phosphatase